MLINIGGRESVPGSGSAIHVRIQPVYRVKPLYTGCVRTCVAEPDSGTDSRPPIYSIYKSTTLTQLPYKSHALLLPCLHNPVDRGAQHEVPYLRYRPLGSHEASILIPNSSISHQRHLVFPWSTYCGIVSHTRPTSHQYSVAASGLCHGVTCWFSVIVLDWPSGYACEYDPDLRVSGHTVIWVI